MVYTLDLEWRKIYSMAQVMIKQLYDDYCEFYPITSVDAVVGSNLTEALVPETRDLSEYVVDKFRGDGSDSTKPIFKILTYDEHIIRYVIELCVKPGESVSPGYNTIAQNMPFSIAPDMRVCMKTITDDPLCKCVVMMDIDNKLVMSCIPNEIAAENKNDPNRPVMDRTTNINITQISASGLDIQP